MAQQADRQKVLLLVGTAQGLAPLVVDLTAE
jgi:hypothetical protein